MEPLSPSDRVISLAEAAERTGLSTDTLRRCHKREEIKIVKLSPRRVGIRLSELNRFLEERTA